MGCVFAVSCFSDLTTQYRALETCFVYSHWLSGTRGHCVDRIWVKTSQTMHVGGSEIHSGQVAQVQSCLGGPCYILFLRHVWVSKPEKTTETQKQSGHLGPQQYLKAGCSGRFKTCPPSKIPNLPEEDSTNPLPSSVPRRVVGWICLLTCEV